MFTSLGMNAQRNAFATAWPPDPCFTIEQHSCRRSIAKGVYKGHLDRQSVGVIIGWIGVAVLIGIDALKGFGIQGVGQLAVLGASLSYALAAIFGCRFRGIDPVVVATGMLCASTLMALPAALVVERPWHLMPGAAAWGAIFGLAAVSTALAYIIYFRVLAVAGATNILLVTFLIPVSAILLGVLVLGEHPGWNAFGGVILIFAGLIAIDGRILAIPHRKN